MYNPPFKKLQGGYLMDRKKIYNPESIETQIAERFWGRPDRDFELNDIKYQWAYNLWEVMLNNTWFPKEGGYDPRYI